MKKRYIVLLALALLLFLCACGTEVPPTDEPVPPLALRNENTGATISLGMTREEAEALLGAGTYFDEQKAAEERMKERLKAEGREGEEGWVVVAGSAEYETYVYGKGKNFLSLIYEEEVVVGISPAGGANPPGPTNWHDQYGLRYGADKSLAFTHYGEQETLLTSAADEEGNVYSVFEYYYDMDGNWVGFYDNPSYLVMVTTEDSKGQVVAVSMYTVTNPEDMSPPTSPATLQNSATGVTVAPGMRKAEVEALLGEGTEIDDASAVEGLFDDGRSYVPRVDEELYQYVTYGDGANFLWVTYRDSEAVDLATTSSGLLGGEVSESTNWRDRYGLTHGASSALIFEWYEAPAWYDPDGDTSPFLLMYYVNQAGEVVENQDDAAWAIVYVLERKEDGGDFVVHITVSRLLTQEEMLPPE